MSTPDKICKDSASKSTGDDVCDVNDKLQNMSTANQDNVLSVCANCGKEGLSDNMNVCAKCKQVKYCNAVCKKVHKKKHKKDCEEYIRLATEKHNEELRIAADLHDEKLFKEPPSQHGDCPICFLLLPSLNPTGTKYMTCCGKMICGGCDYAPVYDNQGNIIDNQKCAFCRTPSPATKEELQERYKKRVELGDAIAMYNQGCDYRDANGFPQDYTKALELFHRAAELGYSEAYSSIGSTYYNGQGVEVDKKEAIHYFERSAMGGSVGARYNLGMLEKNQGNMDRALKHFMIAVKGGFSDSLKRVKQLYTIGHATKDDYMKALQLYQAYLGEIKSPQRDEAAAFADEYRYY